MSDPPPLAPPAEPARGDPEAELWEEARRAFLAGAGLPLVAERFGFNLRRVQRRAAAQGWRRELDDVRPRLADLWGAPDPDAALARTPELAPFAEAHAFEVGQLLMQTTPDLLARYALRKAGEAAASDQPAAAGAWLRVIHGALRAGPKLDRLRLPFSEADHMRALYAAALRGEGPPPSDAETAGPAPGIVSPVVSPVVSPFSQGGDTIGGGPGPGADAQKSRSS